MNKHILHPEIQEFITANLKTEITKLILKGSPFDTVSMQELATQIEAKKKCETKLPTWFGTKNSYYPTKLNIAQTSSEITAKYKASLVSGNSLIDITGGFGVDSFYFSKKIKKVVHCEINTDLSNIVKHNYKQLKTKNIYTFSGDGIEYLHTIETKIDCIYIDPSRRDTQKGKVFLLKDCIPNVPKNIDFLFSKTTTILLKNSPILDITSAVNELKFVKEIHIVAVENDVKELLFLLEKNHTKPIQIKTVNSSKNNIQLFDFELNKEVTATFSQSKKYLYEPNAAILKSGGFLQVSAQLKVDKIQQHSHLYTSDELLNFPGRVFKIQQVLPYDKKQLLKHIPTKKANITTRNFPETVAQIRKKTKLKDGGNQYLFFTTNSDKKHIVILCEKVPADTSTSLSTSFADFRRK